MSVNSRINELLKERQSIHNASLKDLETWGRTVNGPELIPDVEVLAGLIKSGESNSQRLKEIYQELAQLLMQIR